MSCIEPMYRYKVDDLSHFLNALTNFPYINGITSLLSAACDLFDFTIHLFKSNIVLREVILKSAASRFLSNALLGIGRLTPLVTIASFMLMCPWLIPLVAIIPAASDLVKHARLANKWAEINEEKISIFQNEPTKENLIELQASRESLYKTKQDRNICIGLVIGTSLSALGLLFPPLLIAGIVISLSSAVFGFIDKKYQYSKRMHRYLFGSTDAEEHILIENNTLLSNLNKRKVIPIGNRPSATPTDLPKTRIDYQNNNVNHSKFFQAKKRKHDIYDVNPAANNAIPASSVIPAKAGISLGY